MSSGRGREANGSPAELISWPIIRVAHTGNAKRASSRHRESIHVRRHARAHTSVPLITLISVRSRVRSRAPLSLSLSLSLSVSLSLSLSFPARSRQLGNIRAALGRVVPPRDFRSFLFYRFSFEFLDFVAIGARRSRPAVAPARYPRQMITICLYNVAIFPSLPPNPPNPPSPAPAFSSNFQRETPAKTGIR